MASECTESEAAPTAAAPTAAASTAAASTAAASTAAASTAAASTAAASTAAASTEAASTEAASTAAAPTAAAVGLSAAARARMERQRLRARALRDARLLHAPGAAAAAPPPALDSGGGFVPEPPTEAPAPRPTPAPAPLQPPDQPACLECGARFPSSYLFDAFDHNVCDSCRDPDGAHALLTRTEAKTEFLLKDCDLDARPPPLRCVRRRNPHRGARSDMRLYLRAQVEARALLVWGSEAALEEERAARGLRQVRACAARGARRLRALRMDVRSSLYAHTRAAHEHRWGPEAHDRDEDVYSRACLECGHVETYEKM